MSLSFAITAHSSPLKTRTCVMELLVLAWLTSSLNHLEIWSQPDRNFGTLFIANGAHIENRRLHYINLYLTKATPLFHSQRHA